MLSFFILYMLYFIFPNRTLTPTQHGIWKIVGSKKWNGQIIVLNRGSAAKVEWHHPGPMQSIIIFQTSHGLTNHKTPSSLVGYSELWVNRVCWIGFPKVRDRTTTTSFVWHHSIVWRNIVVSCLTLLTSTHKQIDKQQLVDMLLLQNWFSKCCHILYTFVYIYIDHPLHKKQTSSWIFSICNLSLSPV